jgi:hypothetical protein
MESELSLLVLMLRKESSRALERAWDKFLEEDGDIDGDGTLYSSSSSSASPGLLEESN